MDPNANLQEQERILARRPWAHTPSMQRNDENRADRARLRELREALSGWLSSGGFAPEWAACPRASKHYGRCLSVAVERAS